MALLHYSNVAEHRPDVLMKRVFYGLTMFYQFLRRTKGHLESDDAVRRMRWEAVKPTRHDDGVWVKLVEPRKASRAEADLREFMDDACQQVYEAPPMPPNADAGHTRIDFDPNHRIDIVERNAAEQRLKLERLPRSDHPDLVIRPNTWPVHCQLTAIASLRDEPWPMHRPLLRLFEATDHARWPDVSPAMIAEPDWMMLTEANRPGTDEQRRFVGIALATPDFALLEGPPGSGKTTAICELILQLAKQGKRVLLSASTHVAVDNVLERLMVEGADHEGLVIPVRIGDDAKVSERVKDWRLGQFVETERKRLRREYRKLKSLSPSQQVMRDALEGGTGQQSVVERLILEAANLVCGTSIGILQHPELKRRTGRPSTHFDVLIVDEASKTTFQEFLVPAMLAKRWIIVGDPKQLSPYVDEEELAVNVRACLPDETTRHACVDAFNATLEQPKRRRTTVAVAQDDKTREVYALQCEARGAMVGDVRNANGKIAYADIVLGSSDELKQRLADLPLDVATVRGAEQVPDALGRRVQAWCATTGRDTEPPRWENEVAWRAARLYDLRFAKQVDPERRGTSSRLNAEVDRLLPTPGAETTNGDTVQSLDNVRQVALPSVLESLRLGFERREERRGRSAMSDGLPERALDQRRVLLTRQHRMHPDIASFSHQWIYGREALLTPSHFEAERQWDYGRYQHRTVWIDVTGRTGGRGNSNFKECRVVLDELRQFERWAERHPRADGVMWEAAVLTFYRDQEREIRDRWRRPHNRARHIRIDICTVDRFQGHEADIVFISFAKRHSTSFLESPNRLNVALTRARYQRVIVGDRRGFQRSRSDLLSALAKEEPWETNLEEDHQ